MSLRGTKTTDQRELINTDKNKHIINNHTEAKRICKVRDGFVFTMIIVLLLD